MIKIFKSNKLISLLLIIMCIIIILNPSSYVQSSLNGISVWATKILPLMFPFFVLTRLINNLNPPKKNFMDKVFNKLYNTPNGAFSTFVLSTLSGYPMGAKLINNMYSNQQLSTNEAQKMMSFCSVSGPIFMIGTVGVAMLNSFSSGVIILISNILASLINGLIYRGKPEKISSPIILKPKQQASISDCVYDSLVSILMVGSFIVLSFILIDMLKNLKIISGITKTICCVLNLNKQQNVVESVIAGLLEITRGIYDLSLSPIPLKLQTIIVSSLIGFGGFSIMLQSFSFIENIKMSFKKLLIQKTTQCLLSLIVSIPLSILFLN